MKSSLKDTLIRGSAELGAVLTLEQIEKLFGFLSLLEEWSQHMNLTRIKGEESIPFHILDTLAIAKAYSFSMPKKLIDVGTGAGIPGVVLKIAFPKLSITLLDSTQKKLSFLEIVKARLGLDELFIVHGRAEELGRNASYREVFDLATARALAKLSMVVELALPLLKVGGSLFAYKGEEVGVEVEKSSVMLSEIGGKIAKIVPYEIPGTPVNRSIVVVEKTGVTPKLYPRRPKRMK